jgi:beta-phosphoglucomutase-like phosphatase (HAD superfamily)
LPIARAHSRTSKACSSDSPAKDAGLRFAPTRWNGFRGLLDTLNLSRYFAAICGQDTFGIQKPDPQMLRLTIRRAGGEVQRAIMIGDSITDVRTARAANVPVIAVDFGYSEVAPEALNADRLISSFTELPRAIAAVVTQEPSAAAAADAQLAGGNPP